MKSRWIALPTIALLTTNAWAFGEYEFGFGRRFGKSNSFDQFSGVRSSSYYSSAPEHNKMSGLSELSLRAYSPKTSLWQIGVALDWILPGSSTAKAYPVNETAVTKKSRQGGWTIGPSFIYQPGRWTEKNRPFSFGIEPGLGLLAVSQEWSGSESGSLKAQAFTYKINAFATYLFRFSERWGISARLGYVFQGSTGYNVTKSEGTIYQDLPKGAAVYLENGSGQNRLTTTYHGPYLALSARLNTHPDTGSDVISDGPVLDEESPNTPVQQAPLPPPATLLPEDSLESLPWMRILP